MKRLLTLALIAVVLIGCGGSGDENNENIAQVDRTAQRDKDEALIISASDTLVSQFQSDLKGHLMEAMQKKGAVGAISVCKEIAPAVADSHSVNSWTIRRVSDKNRNPDNRATVEEKAILKLFADTVPAPPEFYGVWEEGDTVTTYHFYKPIYTQGLCLNCHGDIQTLAPGVLDAVKRNYPDDKATGYKVGDLRGMFVVDVVWPEGRPYAEQLAGDTLTDSM